MSQLSDIHDQSKADLAEHFKACPSGCTTNWIRCDRGWELVAAEENAWHAAHREIVSARPARQRLVADHPSGFPTWVPIDDSTLPTGPAPLLQGDAVPLPGFEDVPVAEDEKARPWTA